MAMDYNSTRSFTMTLAHRAVGDIRRGGFRQLRNYVDMCATLAKNQQQKDFFAYAQKALQRTDSCYYSLIHRLLDSVDEDRICTVGVNMGFGGLIYGASELKKQADLEGQPIAWITAARCGDERLSELVPKAARHGSFVWLLDATDTDPAQVVLLAKANPQSAFGLLADPSALTEDCVKTLAACRNLVVMPLLQTPELTPEVCRAARRLKAQKMFYVLTIFSLSVVRNRLRKNFSIHLMLFMKLINRLFLHQIDLQGKLRLWKKDFVPVLSQVYLLIFSHLILKQELLL